MQLDLGLWHGHLQEPHALPPKEPLQKLSKFLRSIGAESLSEEKQSGIGIQISTYCLLTMSHSISPPTPLNFSTKAEIFSNTVCFFVRYCGLSRLILGSASFSSMPFSVAYPRFKETWM